MDPPYYHPVHADLDYVMAAFRPAEAVNHEKALSALFRATDGTNWRTNDYWGPTFCFPASCYGVTVDTVAAYCGGAKIKW